VWVTETADSLNLKCQTKRVPYKTLMRPRVIYASECWHLSKKEGNMLRIFEKILRILFNPLNDDAI